MSESAHSKCNEKVDAKFIEGPSGPLFCIFSSSECRGSGGNFSALNGILPASDETSEMRPRHIVLFVPPFGEEINLCRRFQSLLRTRLSLAGLHSVQPDLYGTGDSAGRFEDSTWEIWQSDLEYVVRQFCLTSEVNDAANTLSIVAVRAGCLFTQQLLTTSLFRECKVALKNIVFIQPELNGFDIVNRLFRTRITAQRFSGNKTQTSADLWACIESGETVQASGYALSSELCRVLQHMTLELDTPTGFRRQVLFEFDLETSMQECSGWEMQRRAAKPFWQSYDTEPEASLIKAIAETIHS